MSIFVPLIQSLYKYIPFFCVVLAYFINLDCNVRYNFDRIQEKINITE